VDFVYVQNKFAESFTGFLGQEYDRRRLVLGRTNKMPAREGEVVVKLLGVLIVTSVLSAAHFAPVAAQEKFRVASDGFSTAIHAVAWAAYEKKIFQKYGLDGEYLALEGDQERRFHRQVQTLKSVRRFERLERFEPFERF
jgi:hypothetical protein